MAEKENEQNAPETAEPVKPVAVPDAGLERTTSEGTPERFTADRPLTNEEVRNAAHFHPDGGDFAELDARVRREAVAQGGAEPDHIEHRVYHPDAAAVFEQPQSGGRVGTFYGQATNYVVGERDIFASTVGQVITSYTLDAAAISADANGDKVVYEGTVLQASGAKVKPRTSGTAVGVLRHRVNARLGDQDIGMVIGGRLNVNKLWDNGTFGSVASQAQTDLAALGIILQAYDA